MNQQPQPTAPANTRSPTNASGDEEELCEADTDDCYDLSDGSQSPPFFFSDEMAYELKKERRNNPLALDA